MRPSPVLAALALLVACVEPFRGSWIEVLFEPGVGDPGDARRAPAHPELRAGSHLALWAGLESTTAEVADLVHLASFALAPVVNLRSPCLIERETGLLIMRDCAGDTGCEYWKERARLLAHPTTGLRGVVSVSDGLVEGGLPVEEARTITVPAAAEPATPITGIAITGAEIALGSLTLTEEGVPLEPRCPVREALDYCPAHDGTIAVLPAPSERTLDARYRIQVPDVPASATPAERLALCRAAHRKNPTHYVGNPRQLTRPLGGTLHGVVKGQDPVTTSFLGGAELVTPVALDRLRSLFLVVENRPLAEARARPYEEAPERGSAIYLGGNVSERRPGVLRAQLRPLAPSPGAAPQGATVAVLTALGEDEVQF